MPQTSSGFPVTVQIMDMNMTICLVMGHGHHHSPLQHYRLRTSIWPPGQHIPRISIRSPAAASPWTSTWPMMAGRATHINTVSMAHGHQYGFMQQHRPQTSHNPWWKHEPQTSIQSLANGTIDPYMTLIDSTNHGHQSGSKDHRHLNGPQW